MLNPLDVFLRGTFSRRGLTPIPLVSTDYDVVIASGLAVVTTHRLFRNIEPGNIEAVLTFPLPVHATLFELTAEIDGRTLSADAQERSAARRTYENAIERGKSAVLHEELLRGVHMISIANIESGGDIKITTKWAMPLNVMASGATLRIPQTVGDVYGHSTLSDADAILSGGPEQPIMISIRSSGKVEIVGAKMVAGHAKLKSSGPIDIVAELWEPKPIIGNSRGGQAVALTLSPEPAGAGALSVAVLVDHSGSMGGGSDNGHPATAHSVAKQSIVSLAARLGDLDFVDLWEFDNSPTHVGCVGGDASAAADLKAGLLELAVALSPPRGGTEIGRAVDTVLRQSYAQDLLLITDGLSEALDVQRLARAGRRVSVVLIGQSSLEAKIGHLAALTGGDIFIATAGDLDKVTGAAIDGLRRRNRPLQQIEQMPDSLECVRNNVRLNVQWSSATAGVVSPEFDRAAVAIATSLILGCATTELAGKVAAAEGIVSHLTSLVLVDEVGTIHEALPSLRKVPLAGSNPIRAFPFEAPAPALGVGEFFSGPRDLFSPLFGSRNSFRVRSEPRVPLSLRKAGNRVHGESTKSNSPLPPFKAELMRLAYKVDWRRSPNDLICGDLSGLSSELRDAINNLASMTEIHAFAARHGLGAEVIVIALLARSITGNESAKRVWLTIAGRMKGGAFGSLWELENHINASSQTLLGAEGVPLLGKKFRR